MQRWKDDQTMANSPFHTVAMGGALALCILAAGGGPAEGSTVASAPGCVGAADPFSLYGDEIRFDVRRNGSMVGSHTVSFARQGEQITTATRFEVAVDVLFFTAYRYVYASQGRWSGGCLVGLTATTDDNGKESVVRVGRAERGLTVSGRQGTVSTDRAALPTEHWSYGVVGQEAVINTITGRVNDVDVSPAGTETVKTADGRAITARRYVHNGELNNEVWYDAYGRWVKMRFPAKDGSTIEYVCVKCGIDRVASRS